jgi:hypothetical protein
LLREKIAGRRKRQERLGRADSEHTQSKLTIEQARSPKGRITASMVIVTLRAWKSQNSHSLPERKETKWKTFPELVCRVLQ